MKEDVVTYKDRLYYGFELAEFIFKMTNTNLWFLVKDSTRELADDLLEVCNYFVKNNRMRSTKNIRKQKQAQGKKNKNDKQKETAGAETLMKWFGTTR
ncbi:hypothetical protein Glove_709g10 [Diversispora epigaea]|uniref:Uncharacterized protein n=1 Tax=Diversispora epigaea TaxID=1348612 RepID=A0A397G2B4_9GLOM|nr:hypothetical protein Glove_709g10 [Diversispora epigaea]